jgi:multicomponent Na+:H+ antiporter subunit D
MLVLPLALTWFLAVPLALLDGRRRWVGWLAVAGVGASFLATLRLAVAVFTDGTQTIVVGGWPSGVGITLRADALGVAFAVLSSGVILAALTYEVLGGVHERPLPALVLFLATGLNGLFLTGDAFNFYVFFEIAMTSSFVLASYGQAGRRTRELRAALIFTVVNLLGSTLFLAGIAALYRVTGTLEMASIAAHFRTVEPNSAVLIATLIFVAFGIKVGLFPFHFWLPPVYRDAWPAVAAILSGALANIGGYGLIRFGGELLARELRFAAPVLLALGALSVLYGAAQAVGARTAGEALAYSAISNAGYILIALALGGSIGYAAAVIFALINALNKTLLFLAVGQRGRLVGAAFVAGAFSVAGVPPLAGFFGKAALFRAGLAPADPTARAALLALLFVGGALAFVYMFRIYQREYWERPAAGPATPLATRLLVLILAGVVIAVGVWPEPLLALSEQAGAILGSGMP